MASIPFKPLMFDFVGRLLLLIAPRPEFVTQGGFPIKRKLL
jgi:hypothetical protein